VPLVGAAKNWRLREARRSLKSPLMCQAGKTFAQAALKHLEACPEGAEAWAC
jgi:hypothetical protein